MYNVQYPMYSIRCDRYRTVISTNAKLLTGGCIQTYCEIDCVCDVRLLAWLLHLHVNALVSMQSYRLSFCNKSTFLATMSHEIGTPLNGVLGMMDVLDRQGLDAPQRRTVATMRESALQRAFEGQISAKEIARVFAE